MKDSTTKTETKKAPARKRAKKGGKTAAIELTLFAPNNDEAALIGSFSDWKDVPMTKGEDGVFRVTVDLPDGEHRYRFRVRTKSWFFEENSWVTVTDPYATDVDHENDNGVLRIAGGRRVVDEYVWRHDDVPLPPDDALVIYELHVGDFSGGEADPFERGRYTDVIDKLDYLKDLGVNAIELMPVKEYPSDYHWGYTPRYFFAARSAYGETAELKRVVDEAHARGIRVIIDGVYHHSDSECPLAHIDHDYWYHHDPVDPSMSWGPEFDFEKVDERFDLKPAWRYIGDTVRYWVSEYHMDGIRYDAARNIGNFDFMRWISEQASDAAGPKPFYNIAEYLPPEPAVVGPDGPMKGVWNEGFRDRVVAYLRTGELHMDMIVEAVDARRIGYREPVEVVNYLSTHDHDHFLHELLSSGVEPEEAFRRAKLGQAIVFTAFGVPMLWMGEEFGEASAKVEDRNKIDWTLLEHPENRALFDRTKALAGLRHAHPALRSGNLDFVLRDDERGLLAYRRWADGDEVIVVLNLSGEFRGGVVVEGVPADGPWHEWTKDYDATVDGGRLTLDIGPHEAQVFVRAA